jgi:hypothetical protein
VEFDRGSLGALGFVMLFAGLPGGTSFAAIDAAAWGGDRYVAYTAAGRSCVRDTVIGITPSAQASFDTGLKQWIAATPSASLTAGRLDGSGPVTFTACG